MRKSDILVLPSLEEGFGRVVTEAMASGCVPLASEACTDTCRHMETGLRHPVGDVRTLADQITMLYEDRNLLARLRARGIDSVPQLTWSAAGVGLRDVYREVIALARGSSRAQGVHAPILANNSPDGVIAQSLV